MLNDVIHSAVLNFIVTVSGKMDFSKGILNIQPNKTEIPKNAHEMLTIRINFLNLFSGLSSI